VITAIRLPRGEALVSLPGGGHKGSGLGVSDGGLVIDLWSIEFGTDTSCYRDHFSLLVERARPAQR
jgi:hypothetical protein